MNNLLNFKSFFKFLSRNKAYTAIDIFGLSISLMFVILIAVYTWQELSTDRFQEKGDRVCLMSNENFCGSAYRLAQRIKDRYPEVEKTCPMAFFNGMPADINDKRFNVHLGLVDSTFFDMFSFRLKNGSSHEALSARNYAVISETFAHTAFEGKDPIGQTIHLNDSVVVTVNGVMENIKNSAIPDFDVLLRIDNVKYFNSGMDDDLFRNAGSAYLFFQLTAPGALDSKCEEMAEWFKSFFWIYQKGFVHKVKFLPLNELYFTDADTMELRHGDWKFVMVLMSVGVLILIFAIINYINLTVAQTAFRAKEMATRRLLGSSRSELFFRLMMESTILSLVSFLLGLLLAFAALPTANNLLQTQIDLIGAVTPASILIGLLLIFLLGFVSGLLPAIIISNSKPIEVVRGSFRARTKMVFSKIFITFQNVITITLIAVSITMIAQAHHLIHAPLGYRTHNIMDITVWRLDSLQIHTLANELGSLPEVKRVTFSGGTPFNRGNNWSGTYNGHAISFQVIEAEPAFCDMLNIRILQDNHTSGSAYFLNEEAFKQLEIPDDLPSFVYNGQTISIAGKIKDFQLRNIMNGKTPLMLRLEKREDLDRFWNLLVEVQGDPFEARKKIEKIYTKLTRLEFEGQYFDQQVEESFASQKRVSKIVSIFAGIAVLISLLGLLAMSTYFIQQRSSEVAVRKVFGSTSGQILWKLVLTFLNYVGIAFVIAVPLIWYFMNKWLSDYSYRISLSPLIFIAAGLFCLLISFATVFWQSRRAANTNPVESFRNKQ